MAHKHTPIIKSFQEATMFQHTWILIMAGKEMVYWKNIDTKLEGIAKGVGVEFK
jgi:hypothetical protein